MLLAFPQLPFVDTSTHYYLMLNFQKRAKRYGLTRRGNAMPQNDEAKRFLFPSWWRFCEIARFGTRNGDSIPKE
jgi:hypothetical protein